MKGELKSLGLTIILVLLIFAADCAVRAQYRRAVHEIEETRPAEEGAVA